jgi:hypothetical protein
MKLQFLFALFLCGSLFACKEKQKSASVEEKTPATGRLAVEDSTQTHFSIKSYLEDQWTLKRNDPYTILKITVTGGKRDSAFVPLDSILWVTMTQPFLASDISDKKFLGWYKVDSYEDDVTETTHLNYQAVAPDAFTKKMDLAVNPVSNVIKTVFIETMAKTETKFITQKLQYRPDDIIQIVTFEKSNDKPGVTTSIDYRFKY